MGATLNSIPLTISLSKDDNFVQMETDNISIYYPYFRFNFNNNGAVAGDVMIVSWNDTTVEMTCVAGIPNNSGNQFVELTGGLDIYEYSLIVAEYFRKNELIFENWTVTALSSGGGGILLKYKEQVVMTPSGSTTISGVTTLATPGTNPLEEENLEGVCKVIEIDPDSDEENNIISLAAPYDVPTREVSFNLKNLATVKPHLPTGTSMEATVQYVHHHEYAHAHEAYRKMYVRYADRYGTPAIAESLKKSAYFYMINGGSPATSLHEFQMSSGHRVCHSHIWEGSQFYKPVGTGQPDWVYFMPVSTLLNVQISAYILYEDGTDEIYDVPTTSLIDLDAYKLYYFASGYLQMAIDQAPGVVAGKTVLSYQFRLNSSDHETVYCTIGYDVDYECPDWTQYLLFDNGLGGCESVWIHGKKESLYNVGRELFQSVRTSSFNINEGEVSYFAETGTQGMEVSTGWHTRNYIEHLRQLFIGETWLIDTLNSRFVKILIETSQIKPSIDDEDLFSIQFTYRIAANDAAYHER